MTGIRNIAFWIAGTVSAILFADAVLSAYKVLEFRAAFPSNGVLLGVLMIYGAVATGSAMIVYAVLSFLGKWSRPALVVAAALSAVALAANLIPLPDLAREALRNKNVSLAACFILALSLGLCRCRLARRK